MAVQMSSKRGYAEVTQTVQDSPVSPRPSKKIRLAPKRLSDAPLSLLSFTNLLENCNNSNVALNVLIQISDCMNFEESEYQEGFHKMGNHFKVEQESAVRVKILALFADMATNPRVTENSIDSVYLIDEIINLLKSEKSSKVISQGLLSCNKIGRHQVLPISQINKILNFAKSKLTMPSHNVQRHSLLILGYFSLISDADAENLELVAKYTDSPDARVRAQAFRSILTFGERGIKLTTSLYTRAVEALKDDYECVRREAIRLIHELGNLHSEYLIAIPDSDTEIRLVDDAFGKICSSISDLSMNIRTQAAQLLGGMTKVSAEFLHQTLDKKLMSNMRRKKSLHERSMDHFTSGEWSSGKKWADDAPKELVNAKSVSLMASGACGALVQGLEDEFLEVRIASVDSMCRLALENPSFAATSLDFLVDMFNDEIEEVRLRAIFSLTAISEHIILREDQLEIMLSSLEDYSVEVREGLHLMLGACKVSTKACLTLVVHKILDVLAKYSQDKLSTFGCLQRVGQKHPELCMSLTTQLLQDHPFFDSSERDVEDPSYICILILLFNAAQFLPPMLSLFPDITIKHYAYLRDTMPNFVPHLPLGDIPSNKLSLVGSTGSKQFLETLLNNIEAAYSAPKARQSLLEAAQDNLDRLATIDPSLCGTANFTAIFLGTQLLIEQLQGCTTSLQNKTPSKECMHQLTKKCLKLQNLFSNLTIQDLLLVKQLCLRATALHLVLVVKDRSQSALAPCQLLLHVASDMNYFLQENPNNLPDYFTTTVLTQLSLMNDPKPGRVYRELLPLVQSTLPIIIPHININIKMCTARILEPNESTSLENVVKVTAGLVAAIPIVAEIENLQEYQRHALRLRIKYPDQNVHIIVPRLRDLKKMMSCNPDSSSESNWRLRTIILLSHGIWSESSHVEISICLSVKPVNELELCKPVKILFSPKPVKRGI